MRPARSTIVLLALLLANAAAMLFFRFFISVDGPIHVMRAYLLDPSWSAVDHVAHGITYRAEIFHAALGDRILMGLLLFLSPADAHDVYAAFVSCAVVVSVFAFLHVHGTRISLAILWLGPIAFNVLLLMGLFNFLLGVAIAFASLAWWKWCAGSPVTRWIGLLIGSALAWYTHRGGFILLCLLFLLLLVVDLYNARISTRLGGRRSLLWPIAIVGALAVAVLLGGDPFLRKVLPALPREIPDLSQAVPLRPLFLLDHANEAWLVVSTGVLLLVSFCAGLLGRARMGRALFWHDILLVVFLGLIGLSWIYGTHVGHKFFIAERCQWLALLTLALWLTALADLRRGRIAHVIGGAAVCALAIHAVRLMRVERSFAELRPVYASAIEACEALTPRSLVLPVMTGNTWLLQHLEAYLVIEHDGIIIAPQEHLEFTDPTAHKFPGWRLRTQGHAWLRRHWRGGIATDVDQVLFIGSDVERVIGRHPWPALLAERYRLSFENDHARIYSRAQDE